MPDYDVTSPDGQKFRVTAPEGATQDQVLAYAQQNFGQSKENAQKPSEIERTGAAFDKSVGKGPGALGNTLVAAGENAAAMASGIVGDVVGAGASIATQNPKTGNRFREALTYTPKTEEGKAGAEYLGALTAPVASALEKGPKALEEHGHPILGQTLRAVEDVAPAVLPKALGAARNLARPAAEAVAGAGEKVAKTAAEASAEKDALVKDARKLNLKLTPQDVGAPIGRRVAAVASRPELEREISRDNAAQAKKVAAQEVGIKEPLSTGSVNKAIKETLAPYTAPRKLGRIDLASDAEWQAKLNEVRGIASQEALDYPEDVAPQIEKEVAKFDRPNVDANSMVSKIAKLRERASDNFGGNADDKALARAQRQLATAMEEAIERHGEATGQGGIIKDFRAARTKLAKLYTLRDALTESGELDLGELERRLNRGEPLSGTQLTLARAKSAFDRSFQNPDNIRSHPLGFGDVALGALAGGAKGAAAGGAPGVVAGGAAFLARPAARAVMRSKPYQKAFIKPPAHKPSLTSRVARKIAGPTVSDERPQTRPATVSDE